MSVSTDQFSTLPEDCLRMCVDFVGEPNISSRICHASYSVTQAVVKEALEAIVQSLSDAPDPIQTRFLTARAYEENTDLLHIFRNNLQIEFGPMIAREIVNGSLLFDQLVREDYHRSVCLFGLSVTYLDIDDMIEDEIIWGDLPANLVEWSRMPDSYEEHAMRFQRWFAAQEKFEETTTVLFPCKRDLQRHLPERIDLLESTYLPEEIKCFPNLTQKPTHPNLSCDEVHFVNRLILSKVRLTRELCLSFPRAIQEHLSLDSLATEDLHQFRRKVLLCLAQITATPSASILERLCFHVWRLAGCPKDPTGHFGETHLLDDPARFIKAIEAVNLEKSFFDRLKYEGNPFLQIDLDYLIWIEHGKPEGDPYFGTNHRFDDFEKFAKAYKHIQSFEELLRSTTVDHIDRYGNITTTPLEFLRHYYGRYPERTRLYRTLLHRVINDPRHIGVPRGEYCGELLALMNPDLLKEKCQEGPFNVSTESFIPI